LSKTKSWTLVKVVEKAKM
ncbi:30S ribosomal protein S17, partial [Vibrio parahaemolyticus EKP-028]